LKLPIDTSSLKFMCALAPRLITDEEAGQPNADDQGRRYSVALVVLGQDGAQVLVVDVAGEPAPAVRQGTFVKVSGMAASSSWIDGPEIGFTATSIEALGNPRPDGSREASNHGEGR